MSGRQAEASRNDELVLAAARAVLTADPGADVRAFRSLVQVCRGGHLHERSALLPR